MMVPCLETNAHGLFGKQGLNSKHLHNFPRPCGTTRLREACLYPQIKMEFDFSMSHFLFLSYSPCNLFTWKRYQSFEKLQKKFRKMSVSVNISSVMLQEWSSSLNGPMGWCCFSHLLSPSQVSCDFAIGGFHSGSEADGIAFALSSDGHQDSRNKGQHDAAHCLKAWLILPLPFS